MVKEGAVGQGLFSWAPCLGREAWGWFFTQRQGLAGSKVAFLPLTHP